MTGLNRRLLVPVQPIYPSFVISMSFVNLHANGAGLKSHPLLTHSLHPLKTQPTSPYLSPRSISRLGSPLKITPRSHSLLTRRIKRIPLHHRHVDVQRRRPWWTQVRRGSMNSFHGILAVHGPWGTPYR